jgi:hypothetical protein
MVICMRDYINFFFKKNKIKLGLMYYARCFVLYHFSPVSVFLSSSFDKSTSVSVPPILNFIFFTNFELMLFMYLST